jgi:hypothetical protein
MSRVFTPRPYQRIAFDWMLEHPRCALWAGMGMGKSVSSLNVLDALYVTSMSTEPTLVLGPKRVAENTWPNEARKWEHLLDLEVIPIVGDIRQRKAAMARKGLIYTTNYEQLPWLVEQYGEKWPFRNVIADEATRLKGFRVHQGGKRAHSLALVAHTFVERWINLTGTPSPNGLKDLWGQTWFLDGGKRLGYSYEAFKKRWFAPNWSGHGIMPFPHSQQQIQDLLYDICLTLDPADWFDLQKPVVTPVKVQLPPKARLAYKELEAEMFTKLECGTEIELFNAASLVNKCMQLANGACYLPDGTYVGIHDEKLDALESIQNESSAPLFIAYQFVSDKERILKRFPKFVDISTKPGFKAFMKGDVPGGLAHPQSMGHGIDGLQDVTNVLVRYGHGWDLEQRLQMLERIGPVRQEQSGHKRLVYVYDLIAEDTVDEDVIERHESKLGVQDLLLASMKRKKP